MTLKKIAPLSVIDFRVLVYNILNYFKGIHENYPQEVQNAWLRAAWAINLNRGFTGLPYIDHTVVVVDDTNPYWRTEYLDNLGFPKYKDGRKQKGDEWYKVAEAGKDYILAPKSPLHFLAFKGYEADDIAGALCRIKAPRLIMLNTVDSDWSGLVHDSEEYKKSEKLSFIEREWGVEPTVWWCNHSHWSPRFRDTEGVRVWTKKRVKVDIDKPAELWHHKAIEGDKSDNLPKNSPIEVIDLNNPPKEFDILEHEQLKLQVEEVAHSYKANSRKDHILKSEKWFESMGFVIPAVDYKRFRVR